MKKEKILVLFGGKSVEHDISIITTLQMSKNLPKEFDFVFCYIDKKNGQHQTMLPAIIILNTYYFTINFKTL